MLEVDFAMVHNLNYFRSFVAPEDDDRCYGQSFSYGERSRGSSEFVTISKGVNFLMVALQMKE